MPVLASSITPKVFIRFRNASILSGVPVISMVMLAVETYDSNLVIIEPKDSKIKLKESKEKFLRPEGEKRESFFSRYFYRLSKLLTKDKKR